MLPPAMRSILLNPLRKWFRGVEPGIPAPEPAPVPAVPAPPVRAAVPAPLWPPERLAITSALWGEGFQSPGGEPEILRLAKPLGLSAASSLLLLGCEAGGPPRAITRTLGPWVNGFEADPALAAAAAALVARANLTRRITIGPWNPAAPAFRPRFHHHALALEPLRGAPPEPVFAAVSESLKPGGQLVLIELVADPAFDPAHAAVTAWAAIERRDPAALPSEAAITGTLRRLRFDVRVVEDVSDRQVQAAMAAWRGAIRRMEGHRPPPADLMRHVREAELWLLRLRLFRRGWLRLMRWHAIGGE
jgi:hypothetical protein